MAKFTFQIKGFMPITALRTVEADNVDEALEQLDWEGALSHEMLQETNWPVLDSINVVSEEP